MICLQLCQQIKKIDMKKKGTFIRWIREDFLALLSRGYK